MVRRFWPWGCTHIRSSTREMCAVSATAEFWQQVPREGERIALVDGTSGESLTYRHLYESVRLAAGQLRSPRKKLALLRVGNDVGGLLCYLTLLAAGHVVWPWPHDRSDARDLDLLERYKPDAILWARGPELQLETDRYKTRETLFGYTLAWSDRTHEATLHQDLALVLPTSGSTGNPRLVRLSYRNLASNAAQIVRALRIAPDERWLCSLPFHYVFGLSVVNSALHAGATLVIGDKTVMQQGFWRICREQGVTGLPAIPSQLKLIRDVGHTRASLGSIRKIAISGGAMEPVVRRWLIDEMVANGMQVYSMYGMTEAAGRIAVLPAHEFERFPESVGRAVDGGALRINAEGEVEYTGPNVMMGYAESRAQLSAGDELGCLLRTGDLGNLDETGRLYLTGRRNRICKLFGTRIDLNDIEAMCEQIGPVAVVSNERAIHVCHTRPSSPEIQTCLRLLSKHTQIPIVAFIATQIAEIPRTASGKTHYAGLLEQLAAR